MTSSAPDFHTLYTLRTVVVQLLCYRCISVTCIKCCIFNHSCIINYSANYVHVGHDLKFIEVEVQI